MAGDGIIRIGLVGAGTNTKRRHIPGFRAQTGVEIVSVANRSWESAERVAAEYEIPQVYESWKELIEADDTDAICVGTWPYMHKTLVLAALENNKHVLTEARMAMDAREAREMLDASRRRPHLVTQIVPAPNTLEVDPMVDEFIADGYLGQLLSIKLRVCDAHGRTGGGTFVNYEDPLHWRQNRDLSGYNTLSMGIWYETIMRWVGPATRVMAMTRTFVKQRRDESGQLQAASIPDHVDVICEMACGAQAQMSWSSSYGHHPGSEVWLFGSEGTLHLQGPPVNTLYGGRRSDNELKEIPIPPEKRGKWRVEEEFINAIQGKEKVRLTDFATGVKYMEFTEAVYRSSQEGRAISLPL